MVFNYPLKKICCVFNCKSSSENLNYLLIISWRFWLQDIEAHSAFHIEESGTCKSILLSKDRNMSHQVLKSTKSLVDIFKFSIYWLFKWKIWAKFIYFATYFLKNIFVFCTDCVLLDILVIGNWYFPESKVCNCETKAHNFWASTLKSIKWAIMCTKTRGNQLYSSDCISLNLKNIPLTRISYRAIILGISQKRKHFINSYLN